MLEIDGSQGEGGGQILRTALSLACITGRPFRIANIRRGRAKPGLMPQHLMAVRAAREISAAEVTGDGTGSLELSFAPRRIVPGTFHFPIGTAGAVSLVLQTLLPPLLLARERSVLTLQGGTHVPFSPSIHYLSEVFLPLLGRLGGDVRLRLDACGFYPRGGGEVRCTVEPSRGFAPLSLTERGRLLRVRGISAVGNLPHHIAERQRQAARELLEERIGEEARIAIKTSEVPTPGQGTFIFLMGEYEHAVAGFTALGARGKRAEEVGREAAEEFLAHHATGAPVDPHLADQLVLYLALARGESRIATSRITSHLETNLRIAGLFLPFAYRLEGERDRPGMVTIVPSP
jgi:RNA 3'-terminal phosphate cyclase (ATP)